MKFYYFDLKGRGDATRLAIDYGQLEVEDINLNYKDFCQNLNNVKSEYPFKTSPKLVLDDGTTIVQSLSILQYIGSLTGTLPKDPWEASIVLQVVFAVEDVMRGLFLLLEIKENLEQKKKDFIDSVFNKYIPGINEISIKFGFNGYSFGNEITIADFQVAVMLDLLVEYGIIQNISSDERITKDNKAVYKIWENVRSQPKLQKRFALEK